MKPNCVFCTRYPVCCADKYRGEPCRDYHDELKELKSLKRGISVETDYTDESYAVSKKKGTFTLDEIRDAMREAYGSDRFMMLIDVDDEEQGFLNEYEGDFVKLYLIDTVARMYDRKQRSLGYWGKLENGKMLSCSVCGAKYRNSGICEVMRSGEDYFDYEEPRYCPHCGAKMEE